MVQPCGVSRAELAEVLNPGLHVALRRMPTPGKHARKNNFAAPSLAGSCDAPATPQRSAERSEQSPIAGDVTLVPSQLVLPSPFSQVQVRHEPWASGLSA